MAENYQGVIVKNKAGQAHDLSQYPLVGYYFSASWCPPCQAFTPVLEDVWNAWSSNQLPIQMVLVSGDKDPIAAYQYYNKMSFCMLDFNNDQRKSFLSQKYGVSGIPSLVVVAKDGSTVSSNGVQEVKQNGYTCFDMWMEMSGQKLGDHQQPKS